MRRFLFAIAAVLITACGSDDNVNEPPPPEPAILEPAAAVPVTGTVGDQVPVIVTVLTTPSRTPVANTPVTFAITSGGGSVSPATATTDAAGRAQVTWTLGNAPGENVLTATREDKTLRFTVSTQPGNPARITVQSGDAQTAQVTSPLPQAVSVRVTDRLGNPRSDATVTFQTSDGAASPTSAVTNAAGIATTNWILGQRAGLQQL